MFRMSHINQSINQSVLKTNKQTNKQARIFKGFWLNCIDERHMRILNMTEDLLKIDPAKGFTGIVLDALEEFGSRHLPSGNNQLKLGVFTTQNIPLSEAAKEKLEEPAKPLNLDYGKMTADELQSCLKKRFLPDFDRMAITFLLKKKGEGILEET